DGVHSPLYNISGGADEFGTGSAHEFPWKDPLGLQNATGVTTVRGMLLPEQNGVRLPIVYYRQPVPYPPGRMPFQKQQYAWLYPAGTVFVEVLFRTLDDGSWVAFEVRTRKREPD